MRLAIGCDHGGFNYKERLKKDLEELGHEVIDCGTYSNERCDYPVFAFKVGEEVAKNGGLGILICNSGEGVAICANKVKGIRAGIGYNDQVAELLREHNDANVITFGANFQTYEEVLNRIKIFISSSFAGDRHERRVNLIKNYEK